MITQHRAQVLYLHCTMGAPQRLERLEFPLLLHLCHPLLVLGELLAQALQVPHLLLLDLESVEALELGLLLDFNLAAARGSSPAAHCRIAARGVAFAIVGVTGRAGDGALQAALALVPVLQRRQRTHGEVRPAQLIDCRSNQTGAQGKSPVLYRHKTVLVNLI
jgi:hypothetical protein